VLCKLIEAADDFYGLIFCQTKALVADLYNFLQTRGYQVDSLHGDKDQNARERTLKAFRDRNVTVLVCTDVAARGIDVKDVTHVINYSIPRELDSYVHRIGRTARSGKKGFAFSLIAPSQRSIIFRVERLTKRKLMEGKIPTRKEIGAKKVRGLLDRMKGEKGGTRALALMGTDWKEALEGLSAEEVASRFVALTFPDIFKEMEKAPVEQEGKAGKSASRKLEPVVLDGNQKMILPEPPARSKPRFEERFDDEGEGRGPRGGRSNPWDRDRGPRRGFSGRREESNYEEAPAERPARKAFSKPAFLKKDFERGAVFPRKAEGGFKKAGTGKSGTGFRKDREERRPAPGKGGERALRRSDF
jgi:ATP-dependent RNA helicase DeaD